MVIKFFEPEIYIYEKKTPVKRRRVSCLLPDVD